MPAAPRPNDRPDWAQANPRWIERALAKSQTLPSGGWFVLGASRSFARRPRCIRVADRALVVWRAGDRLAVAPNACPHMGASLADGHIRDGRLVCPWHGLALSPDGHGPWRALPSHDDGVLLWVRVDDTLPPAEPATDEPFLAQRPAAAIDAFMHIEARCDPQDIIATRLDPWHGVHFHAHSFGRLRVIDHREDQITVRVAYKVLGPASVEVAPRTIVMTIVAGDGQGSVVETHATPLAPGRTATIEATLATSDRRPFPWIRCGAPLLRPLMQRAARRLWLEDAAYAERRYALRRGEA